jgi:branched-chain amino acid transport system substrate-binding protein
MGSALPGGGAGVGGTTTGAGAQSGNKEEPTATDVGITPTEIHIAVIADVDNSFAPGLFKASVDGVKGVAKYINATGGLAGRKLVVDLRSTSPAARCRRATSPCR